MLSSMAGNDGSGHRNNRPSSSSSIASSTSSSSPSPFSPTPFYHNTSNNTNNTTLHTSKTMEEVWKDIASLQDHHHHHHQQNPTFILQDFFARPSKFVSSSTATTHIDTATNLDGFSTVPQPPATVLSLNSSALVFDFLDQSEPLIRPSSHHLPNNPVSNVSSFTSPFDGFDSSSGLPSFPNKRVQESDTTSCDRRNKRMIKNRESAARSRARKQAYTYELELEVAHLLKENAKLKRQQEELQSAAAQLSKKYTLRRWSTAPF